MQQIATALAIGRDFIAPIEQEHKVLMLVTEDDEDELVRRQFAICNYYGIRLAELKGRLIVQPLHDVECALVNLAMGRIARTKVLKDLREQIADCHATVCSLDNIWRFFGGHPNDQHHVMALMSALAWAGEPTKAAMLLVGDLWQRRRYKSGASNYYQSIFEDCCRSHLYFTAKRMGVREAIEPDSDVRHLRKRRINWTAHDICRMVLDDGVYQITEPPGSLAFDPSAKVELAKTVALDVYGSLKKRGIHPTAGPGRRNLPALIVKESIGADVTKSEITRAVHLLQIEGRFKTGVVSQYANRTPQYGLILADDSA